jgi:UDP-2,4-diacetamido-2,4,6-trideoxy-beta-L-altropyranose hydrolase
MLQNKKVVFRVDASASIGTGHALRCETLAKALLLHGAECTFVSRFWVDGIRLSPEIKHLHLRSVPASSKNWLGVSEETDAVEFREIAGSHFDWIVTDHYFISEVWERHIRTASKNLLVIDDLANRRHDCDILLDQNLVEAYESRYETLINSDAQTLLGPKFALLREQFKPAHEMAVAKSGEISNLLVFYGGGDPTGETLKVAGILGELVESGLKVKFLVGSANQHREKLRRQISEFKNAAYFESVSDIVPLLNDSDLCLCAGGTFTWERFSLGVPAIVTAIAENQLGIAKFLGVAGLQVFLGSSKEVSAADILESVIRLRKEPNVVHDFSVRGLSIVDGRGAERVVALMDDYAKKH